MPDHCPAAPPGTSGPPRIGRQQFDAHTAGSVLLALSIGARPDAPALIALDRPRKARVRGTTTNEEARMSAQVLVTYGTKHGSTREVAEAVSETLRGRGLAVDTIPAERVDSLGRYAGVVIGGAIYMGRWHPAAAEFLQCHRRVLAELPVAVFGMGPRTMEEKAAGETRAQLDKALERVPEVTPVTVAIFGGVVEPKSLRFPFNRMPASDARDWDAIRAWAEVVGDAFRYGKAATEARDDRRELQQTPR
jgi:menaquinone-dependent protoporphyrinogen oxidase